MNNSFLIDFNETPVSEEPRLREREADIVKLIEAIREVQQTKSWKVLRERLFDGLALTLHAELLREARKDSPDTLRLSRITGQLKWAERYADLSKLENIFKTELTHIKTQLNGTTEKESLG